MTYPTELVDVAKYELHIFDRVSADTGAELLTEVIRLRELFAKIKIAVDNLDAPGGCSGLLHLQTLMESVTTS